MSIELWWQAIDQFMQQGGPLLWVLAATVALIWLLIFERILFICLVFPKWHKQTLSQWQQRHHQTGWWAQALRQGLLGRGERILHQNLALIKGLVAICPMLGLLGTVTGMIEVFDVLALQGTGDSRLMSAGIAKATLPTMAGMVAAVTGLFTYSRLHKYCHRRLHRLADELQWQQ